MPCCLHCSPSLIPRRPTKSHRSGQRPGSNRLGAVCRSDFSPLLRGHSSAISLDMTTSNEPPMRVGIIPVTPLQQNCSLIWCTKTMRGAVIDAGGELDKIKAAVANMGVTLEKL